MLVLYAGYRGIEDPTQNFSIIFVFYTFWLGLVLLSVLFGDVFRAFNPWSAIGRMVSGGFRLVAGQSAPAPFRYPDWLGRWPAVIGVILFVWLELIAGGGASPSPHDVAIATTIYTGITFVCMALFGVEEWIEKGETFNAYFGMFSRLGPFETRDGEVGTPQVPDRRSAVGRDPRSGRSGPHLDRGDELRRRPGGRPLGRDPMDVRALQRHRLQPAELLPDREQRSGC